VKSDYLKFGCCFCLVDRYLGYLTPPINPGCGGGCAGEKRKRPGNFFQVSHKEAPPPNKQDNTGSDQGERRPPPLDTLNLNSISAVGVKVNDIDQVQADS
jgi:hypothetical protein